VQALPDSGIRNTEQLARLGRRESLEVVEDDRVPVARWQAPNLAPQLRQLVLLTAVPARLLGETPCEFVLPLHRGAVAVGDPHDGREEPGHERRVRRDSAFA
jgi:hypothetical protein